MTIGQLIAANVGAFVTVLFATGGLIWHLITQYFDYKATKKQVELDCKRIDATIAANTVNAQNINSVQKAIIETNTALKNEILLQVAEQEKAILMRIIDQEKRNGEHNASLTKAFTAIQNQMELMNVHLGNVTTIVKTVSDRTESMEMERLKDLKEQLDALRKKHAD